MMALTEYANILLLFCVCVSGCISDYYSALGVPRSASEKKIRKAFRRLALKLHPDTNHSPDAHQIFTHLAEAYEVLSNRDRRRIYDQTRHLDQCNKREGQQDLGRSFDSDKGGFYGNSDFLPFHLYDLLEILKMEETQLDMGQGWSFSPWGERHEEEDDDQLSHLFGML